MNLGALLALVKLAQDAGFVTVDKTVYYEKVTGKLYIGKEERRAGAGLGL